MHQRFDRTGGTGTGASQGVPGFVAVPQLLRSHGTLDISFRKRECRTAIHRSYQAGCLRMRLVVDGEDPCAVLINTAGGVAEGDSLDQRFAWDEDAKATVTTQAAEKIYRALSAGCTISTRHTLARADHARGRRDLPGGRRAGARPCGDGRESHLRIAARSPAHLARRWKRPRKARRSASSRCRRPPMTIAPNKTSPCCSPPSTMTTSPIRSPPQRCSPVRASRSTRR